MNPLRVRSALAFLVLGSAMACGGSSSPADPEPEVPVEPGPPATMQLVSGNDQSCIVGTELGQALVVKLLDDSNVPVDGRNVTFVVTSGGGSLLVATSTTGSDGQAATRWTLGTSMAEPQQVEARIVVGETGQGLVTAFNATARADLPATVTLVAGDQQVGMAAAALDDSLSVLVQDRYGNPVAGAQVSWAVTGGGAVSPVMSTTGPDGVARTMWTLGSIGASQRVAATVGSVGGVEFRAVFRGLFLETFEGDLSQWVGRTTGHHAQIVADPLNPGNSVVNFTKTVAAGDIFTVPIPIEAGRQYTLTFDYLALAKTGSQPNNMGGFLGISDSAPGGEFWFYGSPDNQAYHLYNLIEDGAWHSYSITFIPSDYIGVSGGNIHVTLEDGEGALSIPGDAYFDNIHLYATPST